MKSDTLLWTAEAYEALATSFDALDEKLEYVPAWPYIAANRWPGEDNMKPLEITLLCVPVERSQIGRHAYMRDGSRGLRPVPIPEDLACLWRIGVALTDGLGLVDDIDRFSLSDKPHTSQDDLANFMLRTTLSKLRGWFLAQGRYPILLDLNENGLPNIIKRSLSFLRNYDNAN
jgi:hypothetical protein